MKAHHEELTCQSQLHGFSLLSYSPFQFFARKLWTYSFSDAHLSMSSSYDDIFTITDNLMGVGVVRCKYLIILYLLSEHKHRKLYSRKENYWTNSEQILRRRWTQSRGQGEWRRRNTATWRPHDYTVNTSDISGKWIVKALIKKSFWNVEPRRTSNFVYWFSLKGARVMKCNWTVTRLTLMTISNLR